MSSQIRFHHLQSRPSCRAPTAAVIWRWKLLPPLGWEALVPIGVLVMLAGNGVLEVDIHQNGRRVSNIGSDQVCEPDDFQDRRQSIDLLSDLSVRTRTSQVALIRSTHNPAADVVASRKDRRPRFSIGSSCILPSRELTKETDTKKGTDNEPDG